MFGLIPLPYKLIGSALALAGLFAAGWWQGSAHTQKAWDEAKAAQAQHVDQVAAVQAAVTTQVVTQYVDRIKTIEKPAQEVLRAVPTYLPVDLACPAADRIGSLLDAATHDLPVAAAPGSADGAGTTAADVATFGVEAITVARENAEQLTALQEWVKQQAAVR